MIVPPKVVCLEEAVESADRYQGLQCRLDELEIAEGMGVSYENWKE